MNDLNKFDDFFDYISRGCEDVRFADKFYAYQWWRQEQAKKVDADLTGLKIFGYWDTEDQIHYPAHIGEGLIKLGERFNLIPLYCKA